MFKRLMGILMILLSVALVLWIGYNLFIERLPETRGRSPWRPLAFAAVLLFVGIQWARGKS